MKFQTLTSTLVLSFLLAGSHAIAMDSEKEDVSGSLIVNPTMKYTLTDEDHALIARLKGVEKAKAQEELSAKVERMVAQEENCTAYLTAINAALKEAEEIGQTPPAQVLVEGDELTKIDLFTQSTIDVDLVTKMAAALMPDVSDEVRAVGEEAAQKLRQNALNRKKEKAIEDIVSPPLTQNQEKRASWLWDWKWNGWSGQVTPPQEGDAPKVTITISATPQADAPTSPVNPEQKEELAITTLVTPDGQDTKEAEGSAQFSILNPFTWGVLLRAAPSNTNPTEGDVKLNVDGQDILINSVSVVDTPINPETATPPSSQETEQK